MTKKQIRVLLVEDDSVAAFLVCRLMRAAEGEFCVQHVTTAADAAVVLAENQVDVVLLDLGLPDSQGFDTVLRIRTSFPSVPVVVLTGDDDEEIGLRAIECGAQDFVVKDLVAGQRLFRAMRYGIARHNQITHYKALARTDALTGLPNRHAFDLEMARIFAGWKRNSREFLFLLLDIDHFKRVNDVHGHPAGDHVLSRIAAVITDSLRETDFAARFGGEEFAVVLPDAGLESAGPSVLRLLNAIRESSYLFDETELKVTASIGIAAIRAKDDIASLIERADKALYAAKEAGRDQIQFHDGRQCQAFSGKIPAATNY